MTTNTEAFNVLIAGAGVAGLEAAFALRDLAGDRASVRLLAADSGFVYRPMVVGEPFGYAKARRYPLEEIAQDAGAQFIGGRLRWLDTEKRIVHCEDGGQHHYDALLVALGARKRTCLSHAVTVDDTRIDEQLHGLVQDIEAG